MGIAAIIAADLAATYFDADASETPTESTTYTTAAGVASDPFFAGWLAEDPAAAAAALWRELFGESAPVDFRTEAIELEDRWILNRLAEVTAEVNASLEKRRLNDAAYAAYNFFRHELCDWYLEAIKPRLRDESRRQEALALAVCALATSYKLLHPVIPFITEELWQALPGSEGYLMTSRFPTLTGATPWATEAARFNKVIEIVAAIRSLRTDLDVPPGKRGHVVLRAADESRREALAADAERIALLAKLERVEIVIGGEDPSPSGVAVAGAVEIFLLMAGLVDLDKERDRLNKELARVEGFIKGGRAKLGNENFTARAPQEVVDREQQQLTDNEAQAESLRERLSALG